MVKGVKRLVADVNDNRAKHAPCLHFHQVRSVPKVLTALYFEVGNSKL